MNNLNSIKFDNVSLNIPILDQSHRSFRNTLLKKFSKNILPKNIIKRDNSAIGGTLHQNSSGISLVNALNKISFEINAGDKIAIIGHNGSGKTTLLRVISGIYHPTVGDIKIHGKITPLFNMMEGLAPDASGLENIRIRGLLLGLTKKEIDNSVEDIINFSELGNFIDLPVRVYSTGMLVRLMFAISTAITPEILVMDEFIGAGDADFFEKANQRLKDFVSHTNIMIVATHSPNIVLDWCNKVMLMEKGNISEFGDISIAKNYFKI